MKIIKLNSKSIKWECLKFFLKEKTSLSIFRVFWQEVPEKRCSYSVKTSAVYLNLILSKDYNYQSPGYRTAKITTKEMTMVVHFKNDATLYLIQ